MKTILVTLLMLFSLAGFSYAADVAAPTGRMPTELSLTEKKPDCLDVYAGGVTGPGSGYTVANNCPTPVTISGIASADAGITAVAYDVHLFNLETTPVEKRYDFSRTSGFGDSTDLKVGPAGQACSHDDKTGTMCGSLRIAPGEGAQIFGPQRFIITGTPRLSIKGESMHMRSGFDDVPAVTPPVNPASATPTDMPIEFTPAAPQTK